MEERNDFRLLLIAVAGYAIAFSGWNAQPAIMHTLIEDLSFSESLAAWAVALEVVAIAITSFALAPRIGRFDLRTMFIIGAVLTIVGNSLTSVVTDFSEVAAFRLLAGIGEGFLYAASNALIATFRNPDKGYSQVNGVNIVLGMTVLTLLTYLGGKFGHSGIFLGVAGVYLIFALGFLSAGKLQAESFANADSLPPMRGGLYALLLAMMLWGTAAGATWAFLLQLAERADLPQSWVSLSIASWAVGGVAGATIAAWTATRVSRISAMTVAITLNVVSVMLLAYVPNQILYMLMAMVQVGCVYFVMPNLLGMAAALDPKGGYAAAVGGMFMLTGATGPIVGSYLVSQFGYGALGWNFVVCGIFSVALIVVAVRRSEITDGDK